MTVAPFDDRFANNSRGALSSKRRSRLATLLVVLVSLLTALTLWASLARVEEVTTGVGRVIPVEQMQLVQPFEPGIVNTIAVAEGDVVEAGDVLLQIDDTEAQSALGELQERQAALRLREARLDAEARGVEPQFAASLAQANRDGERLLFEARQNALATQIARVREKLEQRILERDELQLRLNETESSLEFLDRELVLVQRLFNRGAIGELEFLRRRRAASEEKRELILLRAQLPRAQAAIAEARAELEGIALQFRADARQSLAEVTAELAVLNQSIEAAQERLDRTRLRAPVRGVVNALPVTTVGAVVRPGESVVEIVPLDGRLLVEAEVRPQDIAFIGAGQRASIKLTAYDYTVYGDLPGTVERISATTFEDDNGAPYYRVAIGIHDAVLRAQEGDLPIIPGMVVTADIQTGNKSVLDYLLNPVLRTGAEALRER